MELLVGISIQECSVHIDLFTKDFVDNIQELLNGAAIIRALDIVLAQPARISIVGEGIDCFPEVAARRGNFALDELIKEIRKLPS